MRFALSFSEAVTGVDLTDFSLTGTATSGASVGAVSGSGSAYLVTVATGASDGTLGLVLTDDDSITDGSGNRLGGTGIGNGSFAGPAYTVHPAP